MRGARHCLEPSPIDPSLDIALETSRAAPAAARTALGRFKGPGSARWGRRESSAA
jgi:hypothetical protein